MIYLDNSSTTPVDPEVLEAMLPYLKEEFGNPSSRHYTLAVNAEKAVENAREQVANLINAKHDEIIFTSGASESNNFIIKGVADYMKYYEEKGNHIITSTVEHKSILQTCKFLNGEVYDNRVRNTSISRFVKLKNTVKKIDRGIDRAIVPVAFGSPKQRKITKIAINTPEIPEDITLLNDALIILESSEMMLNFNEPLLLSSSSAISFFIFSVIFSVLPSSLLQTSTVIIFLPSFFVILSGSGAFNVTVATSCSLIKLPFSEAPTVRFFISSRESYEPSKLISVFFDWYSPEPSGILRLL